MFNSLSHCVCIDDAIRQRKVTLFAPHPIDRSIRSNHKRNDEMIKEMMIDTQNPDDCTLRLLFDGFDFFNSYIVRASTPSGLLMNTTSLCDM